MNKILLIAALVVMTGTGTTILTSVASADTTVNAGTSDSNVIFVGLTTRSSGTCVDVTGGGGCPASGVHNYVCRRYSGTTSSATWYYLGNGLTGLADNFTIRGGAGNDTMTIFRSVTTLSGGDTCQGPTAWNSPTYGTKWLDLNGQSDNDYLYGGDVSTWLWGEGGGDWLYGYSAGDRLLGDVGNDKLFGLTTAVVFFGGDNDDCAEMYYGSPSYSMGEEGGDTDTWGHTSACPHSSFEQRVVSGSCGNLVATTGC